MQRLVLQVQLEHEAAGELPTSGRFVSMRWKPRVWSASRPGVSPAAAAATTPPRAGSHGRADLAAGQGCGALDWIADETRQLQSGNTPRRSPSLSGPPSTSLGSIRGPVSRR